MNHADLVSLLTEHFETIDEESHLRQEFIETFGIDATDLFELLELAYPFPETAKESAAEQYVGVALGLWLAKRTKTDGLEVEVEHWKEAALGYGRVLYSVVERDGGITLEPDEYLTGGAGISLAMDDDGRIRVVVEEALNG